MSSTKEKRSAAALALARRLLRAKARRRRTLARLPVEEKVRILVSLQREAAATRRAMGRPPRPIWRLS